MVIATYIPWYVLWQMDIFGREWGYFDGLVHERRNSSALAMEVHLSCTNLSILCKWTIQNMKKK